MNTLVAANIERRVTRCIAEQVGASYRQIGEITHDTHLLEILDFDSLDAIELIMALEEEFNIEIDDAEAEKVQTVGDAIAAVKARVPA